MFIVWGIVMVGGGFYCMSGVWSWQICAAVLPYSIGVTTVIMGKHIDKLEEDRNKGIVIFSEKNYSFRNQNSSCNPGI